MAISIRRVETHPGAPDEVFEPYPNRDGHYVLAKPGAGKKRNHAENQVVVENLDRVVELVREGHPLRMKSNLGNHGLYSPDEIEIAYT